MARDWTDGGRRIQGISEDRGARHCSEFVDDFLVDRSLYKQTRSGNTDFTLVEEDRPEGRFDRCHYISIGKDDIWRLPTELHRRMFQRCGGLMNDALANSG